MRLPVSIALIAWALTACSSPDRGGEWRADGWGYRKALTITRAPSDSDLVNFPLLVSLQDPALRSTAHGGQVAQPEGQDLVFTLADGKTKLNHEVEDYDPTAGSLTAWVRVPRLSSTADTVLRLYYGNPSAPGAHHAEAVWDASYRMVLHLSRRQGDYADSTSHHHAVRRGQSGEDAAAGRIGGAAALDGREGLVAVAHAPSLNASSAITVEAWVESGANQIEGIRPIVSQWSPRETMDLFEAYDASRTSGLDTVGFFGAVFDGRYVYFVAQYDGKERHGKFLRYDTHGPFRDAASWSAYDAGRTGGMNTKGYYGGAFDGRYVYFTPRLDVNGPHRRVLRYDTRGAFTAAASWEAHDAGGAVSHQGAIFDGRYVYFLPGSEGKGKSGSVLRYDTTKPFHDQASYTTYDASRTSGMETTDYDGGVFDGRYIYLSPLSNIPIRYDTTKDFTAAASWEAFDAGLMNAKTCVGAVFDGRYVYYVPYGENSVVARFDTTGRFTDRASWSGFRYPPVSKRNGYDGGAFDGRFVYFFPFWDPLAPQGRQFHGVLLRLDTRGNFESPASWTAYDAGLTSGLRTIGFNGGAFDGRFIYFAPWREDMGPGGAMDIVPHGRVLRYDTVGTSASFSLRYADYGHNGGLGAALPGPTFLLNTSRGVLGARANRILGPGWHHLAGTYDGRAVRLFVDGELVAEQAGSGTIQASDVNVAIGRMLNGTAGFAGKIDEVRISSAARSAGWLKAQYRNQQSPAPLRVGPEEPVRP
jgi:hypothetical protein